MTEITGKDVIQVFEQWAPKELAVEGDRVGLMIGTLSKPVKHVMTALDVTEKVIDEAIEKGVDLIVAHHPLLFRPLTSIDTDTVQGRVVQKALQHQITIYAAHTNLDIVEGGVNDMLADALSLQQTQVLAPTKQDRYVKFVVFVPSTHSEVVQAAIGEAGAGHIGAYSHCSFTVGGTGTFRPNQEATPFIGSAGEQEYVEEKRIETIVPETMLSAVIQAMLVVHPYEEAAYDVYPLEQKGKSYGLGRVGNLEKSVSLEEFAETVKSVFDLETVRIIGDRHKQVKKVAILGGDGNKYVNKAIQSGADVFVTGDIYYHTAIDAIEDGFSMLDPGHNIEKIMKKGTAVKIKELLAESGYNEISISASEVNTDPYQYS